jgi:hypothetical protein
MSPYDVNSHSIHHTFIHNAILLTCHHLLLYLITNDLRDGQVGSNKRCVTIILANHHSHRCFLHSMPLGFVPMLTTFFYARTRQRR